MFYAPPETWTQELLDDLPFGEDDRYEWKSGDQISKNKLDDFSNSLAKEIGAFANSFGGTLFVGIANDKTKIGVPATAKGRIPTERWLENKIPVLFELRLQHFRVSKVELTETAQSQIGDDRIIVAIDVFYSELAPHQCVFDQRYYYRTNSESRPAPHHYLAFLWGRANSNMPQVATSWLNNFLIPVANFVCGVQTNFNSQTFLVTASIIQAHSAIFSYRINFFEREKWNELLSSDVGEYFLSTFPSIKEAVISFGRRIDEFDKALVELEQSLKESTVWRKLLIALYERMTSNLRLPGSQFGDSNLQEITQLVLGQLGLQISKYPAEAMDNLVRFLAYSLLGLEINYPLNSLPDDRKLLSFCNDRLADLRGKDDSITIHLDQTKKHFETIKSESSALCRQLKADRIDIAKRYTATLGQ
jgi:hypothetical protein